MRRSSRLLVPGILTLFALAAAPGARAADVGVRFGYYAKADEPFVGGELLFGLGNHVYFNPNLEVVLVENRNELTVNSDFHYDIPTHGHNYVWLGAGLALVSVDPDGPAPRHTDAGVNFLMGLGFGRGPVIPYVQAKVIAKSDSEFVIGVGIRF